MKPETREKVLQDVREYKAEQESYHRWMNQLYKECLDREIDLASTHAFVLDSLDLDWMRNQGWSEAYAAEQIHTILGST